MENKEQVKSPIIDQEKKRHSQLFFVRVVKLSLIILAVFLLLTLAGIILGAINFVGPAVQYPSWLLAAWFVVDVLLVVFVLVHLTIYTIALISEDGAGLAGMIASCELVVFIGAWVMLATKHFAWVSICAFGILVACAIIDVLIVWNVID